MGSGEEVQTSWKDELAHADEATIRESMADTLDRLQQGLPEDAQATVEDLDQAIALIRHHDKASLDHLHAWWPDFWAEITEEYSGYFEAPSDTAQYYRDDQEEQYYQEKQAQSGDNQHIGGGVTVTPPPKTTEAKATPVIIPHVFGPGSAPSRRQRLPRISAKRG